MESSSGPREGRPHKGHHTAEFSGGPAIRTWCVHCHGLGLIPGRGTKIPTSSMAKKKRICCWIGLFFRADVGRLINDKAGHRHHLMTILTCKNLHLTYIFQNLNRKQSDTWSEHCWAADNAALSSPGRGLTFRHKPG